MQHFLLSSKARTLSLKAVFRMGEDKAYQTFCELRWPETEGEAICPRCGTEFAGQMWLEDLKKVVEQLGFDYRMGDGHTLQDFCPRCKRIMRGLVYLGAEARTRDSLSLRKEGQKRISSEEG